MCPVPAKTETRDEHALSCRVSGELVARAANLVAFHRRISAPPDDPANRDGHSPITDQKEDSVTLLWFIVWVISNAVGDKELLLTDPVNVWTWTLILAVALDLSRQHTDVCKKGRGRGKTADRL